MRKKKPSKKAAKRSAKQEVKVLGFEDCLEVINEEIAKKRYKWNLSALAWMDYEDVSQILRFHIYKKWHLFNPEKNVKPWIRTIISNQIKNLVRNHYTNFVKPCNKCEAARGESGCEIYEKQCSDCPLYKNWEKNKKTGYAAKMPVPLENYKQEVYYIQGHSNIDVEKSAKIIHKKMEEILKPHEWKIYSYLYIDHLDELQTERKWATKQAKKIGHPDINKLRM